MMGPLKIAHTVVWQEHTQEENTALRTERNVTSVRSLTTFHLYAEQTSLKKE